MTNEPELALTLQVACNSDAVPDQSKINGWARAALGDAPGGDLTVRIVDQTESQQLNAEYRDKDKPTNVLSFPFQAPEGLPDGAVDPELGDLVICAEVVEREAHEQGKPAEAHWAHMIIHGVLHLLGHDHLQEEEAEIMEALETKIMADLGFADPYQPS